MYYPKKDKRTAKSMAKVADSLLCCMRTKRFEKVNVSEIAKGAGISRATFYRLFDTPNDVLLWICDGIAGGLKGAFEAERPSGFEQLSLFVFDYMLSHGDEIAAVFDCGRQYLLQQALEAHSAIIVPREELPLDEKEYIYIRQITIAILVSMLNAWNETGRRETARGLYNMFVKFSLLPSGSQDMRHNEM